MAEIRNERRNLRAGRTGTQRTLSRRYADARQYGRGEYHPRNGDVHLLRQAAHRKYREVQQVREVPLPRVPEMNSNLNQTGEKNATLLMACQGRVACSTNYEAILHEPTD